MPEIPRNIGKHYERVGIGIPVILGWIYMLFYNKVVQNTSSGNNKTMHKKKRKFSKKLLV